MKVTTVYPGAGSEDVEINVTGKIEDQLQDVENLSVIFTEVDSDFNDVEKVKRNIRNAVGAGFFNLSDPGIYSPGLFSLCGKAPRGRGEIRELKG